MFDGLRSTRTAAVAVALLMVTSMAIPVTAQLDDSTDLPETVTYDGQPSFVVDYSDGSETDLRNWVNNSDQRTLVATHDGWAVVAMPEADVRGGVLGRVGLGGINPLSGHLRGQSWVEWVSPNRQLSIARPERQLLEQSEFSRPKLSVLDRVRSEASLTDPPSAPTGQGLAFSGDANRTTMQESRDYTGADNTSNTGAGVTVAVIDTGANTANGEVFGNGTDGSDLRIDQNSKDFIANETVFANGTDAIEDGNGHGTWVASAVAANASGTVHDGLAPDATLLVLRALDDGGSGSSADIAAAIRYAVDNDADVISMSLGSPVYDKAIAEAVRYAEESGVPVVVAAGNSRTSPAPWVASPADVGPAITVAATNGSAPSDAAPAYFSQVGPDPGTTDDSGGKTEGARPDVAAPGMSTVARVPTEAGGVTNSSLSGTSMATPMVAGAIASALETNNWSPSQTRKWVRESARPIPKAGQYEVGSGMLATGNLVTETATAEEQVDARTSTATSRDAYLEAQSQSQGGLLQSVLDRLPV